MIVGVDIGTQSLKVSVLDAALQIRGRSARRYRPIYVKPGWVEQHPQVWEATLGPAIAEALAAAGTTASAVRAGGLCGQLDGCIAVDDGCKPLSRCLTWMDKRAAEEIQDIPPELVRQTCGLVLDPSHLAAKARWLKRHLATERPIARFHQPVSYLVERLTGVAVIDHALASTSMGYALDRHDYDPSLLDRFDLAREELPAIAPAESLAGRLTEQGTAITGLPRGVPVAVGTGDDFATSLGGGLALPGRVAVILGTGEVVGAVHATVPCDSSCLVEMHEYPGGAYFIENPGWLSGGALAWLASLIDMSDFALMDALAAEVAAGADGLRFIPALTGAMTPEWQPAARGCFYGLTPAHHRGHLIRAVLEGCSFAMRDVVDHLATLGVATASLLLLGGGARSHLWAQMRADIAGRPIERPACVDCAPVGSAILAAVAAGIVDSLATAVDCLSIDAKHFTPNADLHDVYEAAYGDYRRLFKHLMPLFGGPAASSDGLKPHAGSLT
jgi:xylulokinase